MPVRYRHRFLRAREFYANALIISLIIIIIIIIINRKINRNQSQNQSPNNSNNEQQTLANQAISGSIGGLQGRCALINIDAKPTDINSPTQTFSAYRVKCIK